ncbi:UDP-N-acetylmuramoyl-tripeptide--D-alanyl-D-alanine ligase [Stenotrophomonas maltophilia]|uniref:UDP-N-acetylmuramoyl-tripeptide--D-alanyl-D- alanine ligase n=1 Tax=Stenotrophomonas maltophilia TaxID=40324 RepID=UPI0021C56B9B|nr:UDP-N-acetylmuramoyl-tripeptide--D-alanyl-D-alanine ligase [Stenotrophomonas maltophilia]MCU1066816.1 UDP-N-acetylmuramoyl-tripeptide--D-alanyl-D-alanine ligase [Stenotrophomonas maltophilia]MCU1073770.1 UDP-N-acetylmuramoyl-tripeptide--D-alanyl-D-alanine ligase [Stenotrophomonas maltophilia]MCU1141347.1 UDP-N-acetylmuramoyl-tripeptide--D-alanyl-D-alanine ligase [Stenotrophomonas maltophilia]
MKRTLLSLIAHWAGGEIHGDDVAIDAVSNDTRNLGPGSLYVALRGERFDGHDFAADAQARGASALLVERLLPIELPQVLVADSELALAKIATGMQRDRGTEVFAVTGSNGKTSVKSLLLSILQQVAQQAHRVVYANPGNRNNEIGLPLAVIDAPEDADYAVYEMGAGKPGDIAYLTDIARPRYALVNNIAPAHLERMGSLLGVAVTKGAIYAALPADGVAVINADDAYGRWFEQHFISTPARCRVLRYGLEHSADVTARDIRAGAQGSQFTLVTPAGETRVVLGLPGRHNVSNALAAASLALAAGVDLALIAAGLAEAQPVPGRQIAHQLRNGAVLVDDSYNANPGSLAAAIDALAAAPEEGWLVLGDMRELGPDAEALHAQAGLRARAAGLKRLYALGPLSAAAAATFGDGGRHFATHGALSQALQDELHAGVRCLVKGSRGSAMDLIVKALLAQGEESPHVV